MFLAICKKNGCRKTSEDSGDYVYALVRERSEPLAQYWGAEPRPKPPDDDHDQESKTVLLTGNQGIKNSIITTTPIVRSIKNSINPMPIAFYPFPPLTG
ncbi:MAG TPA: hypothetical protein GX506_05895 [Firmicutes bacterium]|nr:hypothetical protein [Bacillota bacterium]